jgi:MoaA/NifB/PqqE/SkfB family radical SAM enzyme
VLWSEQRQNEILIARDELLELKAVVEQVVSSNEAAISRGFIAEDAEKLRKIHGYYAAIHGEGPFPYKKCNAPWVSTVIEADGTVRPCFFHAPMGNIREATLEQILNSEQAIRFRKELDMDKDQTCVRCVCYLNLSPRAML